jgi:hypothetical protein
VPEIRGAVDSLCEAGFLEWMVGWSAWYTNGERDDSQEAECMCQGHSSYPWGEVEEYCKWGPKWSDKRNAFVAINQAGRFVELHPDYYVNGA